MSAISLASNVSQLSTTSTAPSGATKGFTWKEYNAERSPEIQQLADALKSGNLGAAEQAYQNLVALGKSQLHQDNPFVKANRALDFNAIGGALQNGDLAGAQQAFADLQSTFKLPPTSVQSASTTASSGDTNVASAGGVNVVA